MDDGAHGRSILPTVRHVVDDLLLVDTGVLRDTGAVLRGVATTLLGAPATADPPDGVLAHPVLRERLQHVGQGWDRRRLAAAAVVEDLAEAAEAAASTYERVDAALARCAGGR